MTIEEMKRRKREFGYTNEMVAGKSGVPLGTVQKIFSGATKAPRKETIDALSRALGEYTGFRDTGEAGDIPAAGAIDQARRIYQKRRYEYDYSPEASQLLREASSVLAYEVRSRKRQGEYTLVDYYALPDEVRCELIDGVIYDMASPTQLHQGILGEIYVQLHECMRKHEGQCFLYIAPSDVELDDKTVVQPDLYIHCNPENESLTPMHAAPDFTLEVVSPSNASHDIVCKTERYKRAGVREYWIVDPRTRKVAVYDFEHDELPEIYTFEDVIPVRISGGECRVDFREVSRRVARFYKS